MIAIVDEGIAVAHDLLRKARTETRVDFAAFLDAQPLPAGQSSIGRVMDAAEINAALVAHTHNDLLDEDALYQALGIIDWRSSRLSPVAFQVSHGTHVAALAAGLPMSEGCETRPVICAALPPVVVEDTTGVDSLPTLYLAFHLLARQARRYRDPSGALAPVIFNFSFGNSGGPHDGTGLFAALFEYYFGPASIWNTEGQKAWLTLPGGNINLGRLHGIAEPDQTTHFDLSVLPDDRTPSSVQMWMPTTTAGNTPELADIRVRTPAGQSVAITSQPGQSASIVNAAGDEVARLSCTFVAGRTSRALVTLSISPTASFEPAVPLAPAGRWDIDVTRSAGADAELVHLWIRRDETLPGTRSGGRQAWFSNPDYDRFGRFGAPLPVDPPGTSSAIRRSATMSGFACGETPIVVAAFTERDAEVSDYSSSGPLAERSVPPLPQRDGPDLAAKGDDSYLLRGVISAGSRSGSWARLSGTSMAAPRVARRAAQDIATWPGGGRDWSQNATHQDPFPLSGGAGSIRAGAGGIWIPIPGLRET